MNRIPTFTASPFLVKIKASYRSIRNPAGSFTAGFSLIELIVIIVILGILATIAIPTYFSFIEKAKITRAISELSDLEGEVLSWQEDHGTLPLTLADIGRDEFLDPWGNPYQFLNFEAVEGQGKKRKDHNLVPINDDFDLYSMGKDGDSKGPLTAKASRDDIIRAHNGQYIGIASELS